MPCQSQDCALRPVRMESRELDMVRDAGLSGRGDVPPKDGVFARYELIDISPAVVEALRTRPLDSLLASFGDHRPSLEPVIGVGDFVAVSVWEAGSGGLFSGPLVADRFSAGSNSALTPQKGAPPARGMNVPVARA